MPEKKEKTISNAVYKYMLLGRSTSA